MCFCVVRHTFSSIALNWRCVWIAIGLNWYKAKVAQSVPWISHLLATVIQAELGRSITAA